MYRMQVRFIINSVVISLMGGPWRNIGDQKYTSEGTMFLHLCDRLKLLKEEPYTQREAEAAAGLTR